MEILRRLSALVAVVALVTATAVAHAEAAASGAAASPAPAQAPLAPVSADDIDDYRAHVEFRCRDSAAARGELREQVTLTCGCLVEGLRDRVPDSTWADAVRATRSGDAGAGQRLLSPHVSASVAACRALPEKEVKRIQAQFSMWPMLHGTWLRTLPGGCVERYTFRNDGSVVFVRGGNVMEQSWAILPDQPSSSRVHVGTRIDSNNGGTDCGGRGRRESSGQAGDTWVFIDYSNIRMYTCATRDGHDCVGPYRVVP